ncbi:hypothetical protein CGGC5_v009858 [Colletotrichum fructicola Nara gc5]|uniref:F-box domain-containing protein n=2 Tax=Colletotrichum fructicola (strain Nara gc5) TaxID=1213859 RepID=A0A7J6J2S1_COLFN|nr:hypothetical protein CGGC5_v009858 [Colletotrichum fructicola Nara gc5]
MKRTANPEERDVAPARSQAKRVRSQTTLDQYFTRPVTNKSAPQEATQQRPRASLKTLPIEVLDQICEYLHEDDHVAPVVAFALACKACHEAAKHILVRTIKFRVFQRQDFDHRYGVKPEIQVAMFHRDIQLCSDALHRDGTLSSVRRLVVDDVLDYPTEEYKLREIWQQPPLNEYEKRKNRADFDGYLSYPKRNREDLHCLAKAYNTGLDIEHLWAPLVALVRKLSVLTDVQFGCSAPFPRWLLKALHERPTTCRLWIRNFRLHSSEESFRSAKCLDDADLELATSPCLYGVRCWYGQSELKDDTEDTHPGSGRRAANATVLGLLTRISPNLKENEVKETAGSLSSLRIKHGKDSEDSWLLRGPLETWSRRTDFAQLQNLSLCAGVTMEAFRLLATCNFQKLTCLDLSVERRVTEIRPYQRAMEGFLRGLSSQLRTLRIDGGSPLYRLPAGLSHTLQTLDLMKGTAEPLNIGNVQQILAESPHIEDLALTIARTKGDATEVALYRALGKFLKLRRLRIRLKVVRPKITRRVGERLGLYNDPYLERWKHSANAYGGDSDASSGYGTRHNSDSEVDDRGDTDDEYPENPNDEDKTLVERLEERSCLPPCIENNEDFDDSESVYTPYKKELIRDYFINIAVDETLVRAIFDVVSRAAGPRNTSPLQSLKVSTDGARDFEIMDQRLWEYHGPWNTGWTVECDPCDVSKTVGRADESGAWPRRSPEALLDRKAGGLDLVLRRLWEVQEEDDEEDEDEEETEEEAAEWEAMTQEERMERIGEIREKLYEEGWHPYYGPRGRLNWKSFQLDLKH